MTLIDEEKKLNKEIAESRKENSKVEWVFACSLWIFNFFGLALLFFGFYIAAIFIFILGAMLFFIYLAWKLNQKK